jgi:two-component sensor histidine kinase
VVLTCRSVPLVLDLDGVTALGLVVSELISNSYDHAFPSGKGTIDVTLSQDDTRHEATLVLNDNGVGFLEGNASKRHGLSLVRRLMQQVHGSVEHYSEHGTQWLLTFPVPASAASEQLTA